MMGLRAAGHRAALVAHPDGELHRRASEGPDLIPLASRTEMDFAAAWRLSRLVRRLKPDVVHANDPHAVAMAALALSLDARGPHPALAVTRRVQTRMQQHAFSRWKYSLVDRFLCASESIRQSLMADGIPAERTVVVREGIDIDRVDRTPAGNVHAELWLPHGVPVVGAIGSLSTHKGHLDLIEAAALVLKATPDARFVIIGEGELHATLEHRVKHLHLERHVMLVGFRPDALSLLKSFDVFAASSTSEGLGVPVLEAMACGKPVVATAVGGVPEVVANGETGLLVPPRSPDAMATALVRLLRDQATREAFGQAGRARVERLFTLERMVRETLDVYAALAGIPHRADTTTPFEAD